MSGNTGYEHDEKQEQDEQKRFPVPKLAGQPKTYLIKAMKDYRSGARKHDVMSLLMSVRTDDEIEMLAEYYFVQKRY